jgi:alkylated DNA repair dioxygenase AlkB
LTQLQKELEFLPPEKTRVKVFGKWYNVPRRVSAYGDKGTAYTYAGGTLTPKPWTPLLTRLKSAVQLRTGCTFNFVLVKYVCV